MHWGFLLLERNALMVVKNLFVIWGNLTHLSSNRAHISLALLLMNLAKTWLLLAKTSSPIFRKSGANKWNSKTKISSAFRNTQLPLAWSFSLALMTMRSIKESSLSPPAPTPASVKGSSWSSSPLFPGLCMCECQAGSCKCPRSPRAETGGWCSRDDTLSG